jgi:single-strand DNA-binding protein
MINRTVLVGRLTKDPELRYTSGNVAYSRFTIAVNRPYKSPNGEREADFIGCVAWRYQAENVAKYMHKGSLVGVEGRIQTGYYDDKETGKRVYTTDVVCENVQFLEPKGSGSDDDSGYQPQPPRDYHEQSYQSNDSVSKKQSTPSIDVSEDDLPF